MVFCIEILGESAFHRFLVQSGWSGRDYIFKYNRHTNSHMRAYRRMEEYYAERVDMHKATNIWPLLGNLLPEEQVDPDVFVDGGEKPVPNAVPASNTTPDEGATPNKSRARTGRGTADHGNVVASGAPRGKQYEPAPEPCDNTSVPASNAIPSPCR